MTRWDPIQKPKQIRIEALVPQATYGLGGTPGLPTPAWKGALDCSWSQDMTSSHVSSLSLAAKCQILDVFCFITCCTKLLQAHACQTKSCIFYFKKWSAMAKGLVNKLNGWVLLIPLCFDQFLQNGTCCFLPWKRESLVLLCTFRHCFTRCIVCLLWILVGEQEMHIPARLFLLFSLSAWVCGTAAAQLSHTANPLP